MSFSTEDARKKSLFSKYDPFAHPFPPRDRYELLKVRKMNGKKEF
jgi:hypothetical protein